MKNVPILMYHEIGQGDEWAVSQDQFEKQMQMLHYSGYKTISLNELNERLHEKLDDKLQSKRVVLTFDDARRSVFTMANPFMKRYNFTGTVFVVPSWVGKEGYMSWDELRALKENGWSIGNHTLNHVNLTTVSEFSEIHDAHQILTEKLGKPEHFAYPYGAYNEQVVQFVRRNYVTAVSAQRGFDKTSGKFARQPVTKLMALDQFQKLLVKPKVSLCVITRDEEKNIEHCITSALPVVDEVIVVDSGSKDKTKEIAARFGKVYEIIWTDFSAARNYALKKATGDWVIVLDADEVLDERDYNTIGMAVNDWGVMGYRIVTRNYTNNTTIMGWRPVLDIDPQHRAPTGWYPSVKVRLFQRRGAEFIGKVHEMVDRSIEAMRGKIATLPVSVHHYGTLEDQQGKREFYSQLTRQKIEDNPTDSKAYFELGVQYKEMGLLTDAEQMLMRSIELNEESVHQRLNLAIVQQKLGKHEKAFENYSTVVQKDSKNADAYFGLGYCSFIKNDIENALTYFKKAVEYNPMHVEAHINLGALYEKAGNLEDAERTLLRALEIVPTHARAHYNLGVVYEKMDDLSRAVGQYKKAVQFHYVRKNELLKKIQEIESYLS